MNNEQRSIIRETQEAAMNRDTRFGQLHLIAWLGISHLLAAAVGALGMWRGPVALTPGVQLAVVSAAGALFGLLLNGPVLRGVEYLSAALMQLAQGRPIAPSPAAPRRLQPLHGLLVQVDALAARARETHHLRDELLRSTGEAAAQAERNRLARDLHDSIKQQLYAINVSAAAALARWETDLTGARAAVEEVRRAAQAALAEMAALLRQLRPAPLAAAGLLDALREQCEALAHRSGAEVTADFGQPADVAAYTAAVDAGRLAPGAEEAIFRIGQEALNNVARHARAGHVTLRLRVEGEALHLTIADDGQGFSADGPGDAGRASAGYGLAGMRDRAAAIGAAIEITSSPGRGTLISLTAPLGEPAGEEAEMNAQVQEWLQKANIWQAVTMAAVFVALVVAQGMAPRLAAASYPPAALVFSSALLLVCVLGGRVAWARAQAATVAVTLACGADSPMVWRMRREAAGTRVWIALAAVVVLPGALMPHSWPQYPIAALAVGAACAVFAALTLAQFYRVREQYWARLSAGALAAELDQAWRGRYSWALVLLVTAVGYFGVYGGFQAPFAWPPSRDLALDILVTVFINLVLVTFAVNYFQLRDWRERKRNG